MFVFEPQLDPCIGSYCPGFVVGDTILRGTNLLLASYVETRGAMKPSLRKFILSPGFIVLGALAGWTTGYFLTWQLSLLVRLVLGCIAAACVVGAVLWALSASRRGRG